MAIGPAVRTVNDHALVSMQNCTRAGILLVRRKSIGFGDRVVSIVPNQLDWPALTFVREFESNLSSRRIGQWVFGLVIILGFRVNARRRAKIKRPKRWI